MKKIILSALMLTGMLTFAQDGKLTVSGTVDAYGTYNDDKGTPGLLIANPEGAQFAGMGMANTIFGYESGKTGAVIDLAYGPRALDAAGFGGILNQAYMYYNVNDKLTFTMGQFNTFLGYEVISPAANFNYTVSYLFNAGPFTHVGIKADYAVNEDLSLMLALTSPHGEFGAQTPSTSTPQVGFQLGYKGQYLNIVYGTDGFGADDQLYLDYTGGFDLSDTFYLGINAAYSNSSDLDAGYQGAALYLQNAFSDTFSLGLRPEFFQTTGAGNEADVFALTLTANTVLTENLSVITDLRYDSSEDGIIETTSEDSVTALTIAAVYSF